MACGIAVRIARRGSGLRIVVRDDGEGVPPELRETLFQPFVSGREGGTGLGLAVSRGAARAHGGDLRLGATGPEGSEFILDLPVAKGDGGDAAGKGST